MAVNRSARRAGWRWRSVLLLVRNRRITQDVRYSLRFFFRAKLKLEGVRPNRERVAGFQFDPAATFGAERRHAPDLMDHQSAFAYPDSHVLSGDLLFILDLVGQTNVATCSGTNGGRRAADRVGAAGRVATTDMKPSLLRNCRRRRGRGPVRPELAFGLVEIEAL